MRFIRRHKKVSGVLGFFLIASASAFAAWLITTPNGHGHGRVGHLTAPVVSDGTPTEDVYPGDTGKALTFSVQNPNSKDLYAVSFTRVGGGGSTEGLSGACATATTNGTGVMISPSYTPPTGILVAAGATTSISAPMAGLSADAPSDCQSQEFSQAISVQFSTSP